MAEKCKPREIYKTICGLYGEAYFSQKMFSNGLNMGLPLRAWVEKQTIEWKHIDPTVKKKSQAQQSERWVTMTVLWSIKGPITIDFLENFPPVKSISYDQSLSQYFILCIEWSLYD